MTRRRVLALAVVAMLTAALLIPLWPGVRLSHPDDGVITNARVPEGIFTLSYVHSIDGLPIEEDIEVRDGALVVQTTRVRQFGAGMGQVVGEGTGRAEGQWWVVEGIERPIGDELLLRAGATGIDHRLHVDGEQWALSGCWAGERLHLEPTRISILTMLREHGRDSECAGEYRQAGMGTER